jgi:hypothetical protein
MELTQHTSNPSEVRELQTAVIGPSANPVPLPHLVPLTWKSALPLVSTPSRPVSPRCREKGCVFPAAREGRCVQHDRQAREPILFSSHQPTRVVLEQGKFGVPEVEVDTSRGQDRRKLAALRESFLEG